MKIFDAHNHIQTYGDTINCDGFTCICNGTEPSDWAAVEALGKKFSGSVLPFFGVHPWFSGKLAGNWLSELAEYLSENPHGIGEIGLDSAVVKGDMDTQVKIFTAQLEIAADMSLPVAVHCVRSWGKLDKIIRHFYPRSSASFMIHSFSGSVEIMRELVKRGGYISFSFHLLETGSRKLRQCLHATPMDRILLESDYPSREAVSFSEYKSQMRDLYRRAAQIKGIDLHEMYKVVWDNGSVFTDGITSRR